MMRSTELYKHNDHLIQIIEFKIVFEAIFIFYKGLRKCEKVNIFKILENIEGIE